MDTNEKNKVSKVFNAVWDVTKRYAFIPLDDYLWEMYIAEIFDLEKQFKAVDAPTAKLYADVQDAVTHYMETKKKEKKADGKMGTLAGGNAEGTVWKE